MTHQRTTIRSAVKAILDAASIVAAGKVYDQRSLAVLDSDLPVIVVETLPETSAYRDLTTGVLDRSLDVTVEMIASNTDDALVADTVDTFAAQIESALAADPTWGGNVYEQHLTSTDLEKDSHGQVPVGRLKLKYQAKYFA